MESGTWRGDVTVVGGGLAGVCAAVAAGRLGAKVALINNRPVLGGNSSSEVRVWVLGANAHGLQRFARENGIIGEMLVENQYRNPGGNPYYWDQVVLDAVRAEPNVRLFLNTDVRELEASGTEDVRTIQSVLGWTMGSERLTTFRSPIFLDCTGDGLVGHLAGAHYRVGREARDEYNESCAPEEADGELLGSTILFYTKDAGRPEPFIPPSIAKDITKTPILENRVFNTGTQGAFYWWIEYGGELDTVSDNEHIRDELWSVIFGIWDYIKNSGHFDADNLTLEWVGSVPGKREYRRLLGDYVLTQNDIIQQRQFDDVVGFGGWSIDLHPAAGVYAKEPGARHLYSDGVYEIPFRCIYSENVDNMLMAGRNISASHVAFGTTRVMATCAVLGEAAGTAAALCTDRGVRPRQLLREHISELQRQLLRQDAALIRLRHHDRDDHALVSTIEASSTFTALGQEPTPGTTSYSLANNDLGLLFPVNPKLDSVEVLATAESNAVLRAELWDTGRPENYVPSRQLAASEAQVPAGDLRWVKLDLSDAPEGARNCVLILRKNPAVAVALADERPFGVLLFERRLPPPGEEWQPVQEWDPRPLKRQSLCFRAAPETKAYEAAAVTDGYQRPFGGPRLWSSADVGPDVESHLQFSWPSEIAIHEVAIIFNDDVDEDLSTLIHHRTPYAAAPELVRSYRIEVLQGDAWVAEVRVPENRRRRQVHRFQSALHSRSLRLVIERTHGCSAAQVVAVNVY